MKVILVKTKTTANIQTSFNPPLCLQANRNYELPMVNLETDYSFANIRGDNNSFKGVLMVARLGQFSTYLQDFMN